MRIDHIAFRVADRYATARFFIDALGYKIQQEFQISFDDGTTADCIALEPPEKKETGVHWIMQEVNYLGNPMHEVLQEYHLPPELFISDGHENSIIGKWVAARNGIGGIHHIAYMVTSVEETMNKWKEKGYAEFTTEEPLRCEGLKQAFTQPSSLTGIIYEFIEREGHGFCAENVKKLMESTQSDFK